MCELQPFALTFLSLFNPPPPSRKQSLGDYRNKPIHRIRYKILKCFLVPRESLIPVIKKTCICSQRHEYKQKRNTDMIIPYEILRINV